MASKTKRPSAAQLRHQQLEGFYSWWIDVQARLTWLDWKDARERRMKVHTRKAASGRAALQEQPNE